MNKSAAQKIVIIGCGNIAWHLAARFKGLTQFSVVICNHRANAALADFETRLNCRTRIGLNTIDRDASVYFICVPDKFIGRVSGQIVCEDPGALILHMSGSAAMADIKNKHPNKAVFYPLQTFTKQDVFSWHETPLLLEAENEFTMVRLKDLAENFSSKTVFMSSAQRFNFHLAAVMVNNFANALYVAASEIIEKNADQPFDLLRPLIRQTEAKLARMSPRQAQTGPARRNDKKVMNKHLDLLAGDPGLKKIYKMMSELIIKQQSHAQF